MSNKQTHSRPTRAEYTALQDELSERISERDALSNSLDDINKVNEELTAQNSSLVAQHGHLIASNELHVRELELTKAKLHDSQQAYSFRHNQALASAREVSDLKHALDDEKFQFASFRRDVFHLFMLEQLSGGTQNELMLTRVRNRVLGDVCPIPQRSIQHVEDVGLVTPPSPAELEETGK